MASSYWLFLAALAFTNTGRRSLCSEAADDDGIFHQYPFGDPRNCLQSDAVKATQDDIPLNIMQVLPGIGWDNLRNLELGYVTELNYSRCRTTGDRRYLIPDNVYAIPIQHSVMQANAKLIHHWDDWKSYTASSINSKASYLPYISGKFSSSFREMKARFINEKSQIARVELRHHFYSLKLHPDGSLDSGFKRRLLEIASHMQNNRSLTANYLAELLVKEYGTDYTTSVEAGALLIQEDYLDETYMKQSSAIENEVTASAAASLFGVELGGGYSNAYGTATMNAYVKNRRYSKRETFGGMPYQVGTTLAEWEKSLVNSMVAIDRNGFPLDYLVTVVNLPELPSSTRRRLRHAVRLAVGRYYYANTYKGCVDPSSPNFDYTANFGMPEACLPPETNTTFGGVYQECYSYGDGKEDLCSQIQQLNPLTGALLCPSGYQSVKIADGRTTSSKIERQCQEVCTTKRKFLVLKKKVCRLDCENVALSTTAKFSSYWCAAVGKVPYNTGYLFGGLFTSRKVNPVTKGNSCPEHYIRLRLGTDITICVTNDYELGGANSLPFAGFHSCLSGNPLAAQNNSIPPKRCPCGYSQHFADIIGNCQVNYCVRNGRLKIKQLPEAILPPFKRKPVVNQWSTDTVSVQTVDGQLWVPINGTNKWRQVQAVKDELVADDHAVVGSSSSNSAAVHLSSNSMLLSYVLLVLIMTITAMQ